MSIYVDMYVHAHACAQCAGILGVMMAAGALCQMQGLVWGASASHAAFLTQMTTLLVPLTQLLTGQPLPTHILCACWCAVPGIACFAAEGADPGSTFSSLEVRKHSHRISCLSWLARHCCIFRETHCAFLAQYSSPHTTCCSLLRVLICLLSRRL
jgi:hypothetical protein